MKRQFVSASHSAVRSCIFDRKSSNRYFLLHPTVANFSTWWQATNVDHARVTRPVEERGIPQNGRDKILEPPVLRMRKIFLVRTAADH